jgi:hypothetical protein
MNCSQYRKLLKEEHLSQNHWGNYQACKRVWKAMIDHMKQERPDMRIVMHHLLCEYNDQHYEEWNPDYVVPMYLDDHSSLHSSTRPQEVYDKIGNSNRGKKKGPYPKRSEESKRKQSEAMKGKTSWNKGLKMSEEFCKTCSETHKGIVPPNKGVPMGEDQKEKLRIARTGKPGHKHTEEHKAYMSNLFKGKPKSEATKLAMKAAWARRKEAKNGQ